MRTRVSKSQFTWLVTRIRKKGERIGTFKAPDAKTAIEKAAERAQIAGRQDAQSRSLPE